ncbi:hypothetical protein [Burkholderia latens]|uniref:hypothetical protein n=1 Tax=Burkholderia latens TaxID=488446 RepID=UPI001AE6FA41|nr:hypothetical protein [Burkholderia latens]QTO42417.1 hypothetical protein J8I85_10050 [Burkholderia latens]
MSEINRMTPEDFKAWKTINEQSLKIIETGHQLSVDDTVIRWMMDAMQRGLSFDDAGEMILRCFNYGTSGGVTRTKGMVRRSLKAIGWLAKRERTGGVAE